MALIWQQHDTPARLRWVTECRSYVVLADKPLGDQLPWWIARHSSGREIAAGYGDVGLAKCKTLCEIDARRELPTEPDAPTEFTRVEIHAPAIEPTEVPTSAQAALF